MKKLLFAFTLAAAALYGAEMKDLKLKARTDKENPIDYKVGETIRFDFFLDGVTELPEGVEEPLHVVWTRTGDDGLRQKGTNDISLAKGFSIETSLGVPGIVRMEALLTGPDNKGFESPSINQWEKGVRFHGGAGAETEKMKLTTVEPDNFDAFWKEAKEKLATVPVKAKLVEATPDELKGKCDVYAVEVDCFGPRPVTGWLRIPVFAATNPLPAVATFDGYNGNNFNLPKAPTKEPGNRIVFHVNAHGYELVGHDLQYYKDFGNKVNGVATNAPKRANYALAPSDYDNPKDTYFYYMAMRVIRAFDYLKTRPEWNGKDLESEGGSQGGLQTMWAGSLVDGITAIRPNVTWGCDIGCPFNGKGPYPSRTWGIPSVPGAFYFDAALHAKRVPVTCTAHITRLGLGDYTCPPRGVLLSYYQMKCPAKALLVQGSTHGYTPPKPNQTFTISK
jgi:cephalosporin-C deacetylase-like acetyl esterase